MSFINHKKLIVKIIYLFYILTSYSAFGQTKNFEFVRYQENLLQIFGSHALERTFEQMKNLEKKKDRQVHILHIGDSHIQADHYSGRMRELFRADERFPLTARGFVFPYKAANTNNPYNYRTVPTGEWTGHRSVMSKANSRWGIAGVTATTTDSQATITINPNSDLYADYQTTKVKVFYPNFDEKSFSVRLEADANNYVSSQLTKDGMVEFSFAAPQNNIKIVLEKTAPDQREFVMQGMSLENNSPGILYSSCGVNGAEVTTFFRCQEFDKHINFISPDLLVISLGTNDAIMPRFDAEAFRSNYGYMISRIQQASPNTAIILTTPGDNYRRRKNWNKNNETAREVIYELAKQYKLSVWDFYHVMGGAKSMELWVKNGLATKDRIHLTVQGYRLQGELFYQAIDQAYKEYCQKQETKEN